MILIENLESMNWRNAIRGMRNPLDSWDKTDSVFDDAGGLLQLGPNDMGLMERLIGAGTNDHAKFRRMIVVSMDVTAPLYWWKEADTYKVGTVANSCSTMHTVTRHAFCRDMFSNDHLDETGLALLDATIDVLNVWRERYLELQADARLMPEGDGKAARQAEAKAVWYLIIESLPTSWLQKRTWLLNYEVLANLDRSRQHHKLDEWRRLVAYCRENLPHPWIFSGAMEAPRPA